MQEHAAFVLGLHEKLQVELASFWPFKENVVVSVQVGVPPRISPTHDVKVMLKESQKSTLGGILLEVLHDGTQSHEVDIFVERGFELHVVGKNVEP